HGAADADHVRAAVAQQLERAAQLARIAAQPKDVERGPARTAAEDRHAVHDEAHAAALGVGTDIAEADAPAVHDDPLAVRAQLQLARFEMRRAVRMRPPRRNVDLDAALDVVAGDGQGIFMVADPNASVLDGR